MPSAREMAGYKNVDATLPARVADGADDERQHRHALEARQSKTEAFVSIVGVLGGVLFVVLMVALAAFAVVQGSTSLAIAAAISTMVPVAIALVNRGR